MYFGITEKGEEERTESNGRQIKKERETEGNTNIKENEETEAKARLYISVMCACPVGASLVSDVSRGSQEKGAAHQQQGCALSQKVQGKP